MSDQHSGQPVLAAIALGSNLGDRRAMIEAGFRAVGALARTSLVARSSIIQTRAIGPGPQDDYLNAAATIHTRLTPGDLLAGLLEIERSNGRARVRDERWGPRTLDLDLLLYGDLVLDEPGLTIPHPRLHERAFVLVPLAELIPDYLVPGLDQTVRTLLGRVE